MKIGFKIRELRKERGITREQVAQYLNVSPRAVSNWEKGKSQPDMSLVPKLLSLFEVSEHELFSPCKNMTDKYVLLRAVRLTYGI